MTLILSIAAGLIGFAFWQLFGGGGPPTNGPDIRHGTDGTWPGQ